MGLESFREAGWFDKPEKVNFDLNEEQLKRLRNRERVEVRDHGKLYVIEIRRNADLTNLTKQDLIIEQLP